MSDFFGIWRTNYVHLRKDRMNFLQTFPIEIRTNEMGLSAIISTKEGGRPPFYTLQDASDLPDYAAEGIYEADGVIELNLSEILHHFIEPGEVIVVMSAGYNSSNYVHGLGWATDDTGRSVSVTINQIYDEALKAFNKRNICLVLN